MQNSKSKIQKLLLFLLFALSVPFPSFALIGGGVLGAAYNYSGTTSIGYGLNVELPLLPIPMVTSRLEAVYIPLANGSLIPILLTGSYKIPMTPVYAGLGAGVVIYNQTTTDFSAPTAINYNLFVGYEQSLMPALSWFIQGAYEVIKIDYKIDTTSLTADFTGASVKGGVRVGF